MSETQWQAAQQGIEVATFEDADEFLAALRRSNSHWWEGEGCPWVFRGHGHHDWELLPSAWRAGNRIMENARLEAARRYDTEKLKPALVWRWLPANLYTNGPPM